MGLFNVFSDPQLVARQQQLDGQWSSLNAVFSSCDATPDSAFPEFATDLQNWRAFYASGSDWSADSKKATDDWQTKAQDWSSKLASWGCTGNTDNSSNPGASGIPTVKDPPPDAPSLIDELTSAAKAPVDAVSGFVKTASWVLIGLAVLVLIAVVYTVTHSKVETPGLKVG